MENIRKKLTEIIRLLSDQNENTRNTTHLIIKLLNKTHREDKEDEEYLSTKMAVSLLDISAKTLYNRRKARTLPFMKIGGNYWYKLSDLLK